LNSRSYRTLLLFTKQTERNQNLNNLFKLTIKLYLKISTSKIACKITNFETLGCVWTHPAHRVHKSVFDMSVLF